MEGVLLADVVIHGAVLLRREVRDGVEALGFFMSTRICAVRDAEIATFNSIYLIEEVTPWIPGLRS